MATNKIFKRFTGSGWEEFKFAAFDSEKLGGVLPSGYALASHSHSIANITGLQAALNGKAASNHNHDDRYAKTSFSSPLIFNDLGWTSGSNDTAFSLQANGVDVFKITKFGQGTLQGVGASATLSFNRHSDNQWYAQFNTASGAGVFYLRNALNTTTVSLNANGKSNFVNGLQWNGVDVSLSTHAHTIANITGLQTALDGKVGTSGDQTIAGIKTFTGTVRANNLMFDSYQGIQFSQGKIGFMLDNSTVAEFDDIANTFTVVPKLVLSGAPTLTNHAATKGYVDSELSGKLSTGGTAADSSKLGNQLPSYYQPALTAITTSNIANQSVNYAASAGSVSNGVYTTGSYSNPSWITSLAATKISGTLAVGKGGTGATTFTSGNVLIGAGTGAITTLSRSGIDNRTAFPTTWANISGTTPTWNQNTTGNAATATLAADSSKLGGQTKTQLFTNPNFTGTVRADSFMYSTYQGIQFSQDKIGFMLDNSIVAEFDDNENTFTVNPRLVLNRTPTLAGEAATKGYVDDKVKTVSNVGNSTMIFNTNSFLTLNATHAGITIFTQAGATTTIRIPTNASVPFEVGTEITIIRYNSQEVTIDYSTGVVIYSEGSSAGNGGRRRINAEYQAVTLKKVSANVWILIGALKS